MRSLAFSVWIQCVAKSAALTFPGHTSTSISQRLHCWLTALLWMGRASLCLHQQPPAQEGRTKAIFQEPTPASHLCGSLPGGSGAPAHTDVWREAPLFGAVHLRSMTQLTGNSRELSIAFSHNQDTMCNLLCHGL